MEMFTDPHSITQRIILMKLKNRTLYLDLMIMNCSKLIFIMMKFQTTWCKEWTNHNRIVASKLFHKVNFQILIPTMSTSVINRTRSQQTWLAHSQHHLKQCLCRAHHPPLLDWWKVGTNTMINENSTQHKQTRNSVKTTRSFNQVVRHLSTILQKLLPLPYR